MEECFGKGIQKLLIHTFVILVSLPCLNEKIQTIQRKVEKEKRNKKRKKKKRKKRKYIPCDIQYIMCRLYGLMPLFLFLMPLLLLDPGEGQGWGTVRSQQQLFTEQDGIFSICYISPEGTHTHTHTHTNITT